MALTNKDIERIGEIFGAKLATEMKPIELLLQKHTQTLYGENGDNGINKSVKDLTRWKWLVAGGLIVLSSATFWQMFLK